MQDREWVEVREYSNSLKNSKTQNILWEETTQRTEKVRKKQNKSGEKLYQKYIIYVNSSSTNVQWNSFSALNFLRIKQQKKRKQ